MKRWQNLWRYIPLFGLMMLLLTGCGDSTISALNPSGPVARDQLFLMKLSLGIMIGVVIIVFAIYLYVIVRFRKKKGDKDIIPKQVEGSHVLEIIWTVIPIFLLLILAVPTVQMTVKLSENKMSDPNAIHVKVTAHQFWWQFEYLDYNIQTAQDLVIPEGKTVALELQSVDVLHAFWVPALAGKQDTNVGGPSGGQKNTIYLSADKVDVFKGKCAELCGASHSLMDFKVVSKSQADFDKWVAKMKTPVVVSDDVKKGEEVFKNNCLACHAVTPDGKGMGPNLNGFASREMVAGVLEHTDDNIKKWIKDPQVVKPNPNSKTMMPGFAQTLKEDQLNELVKYLNALK